MDNYSLRLRNYRCFGWDSPGTLVFGNGFTAFVGKNNSGKSSALRSIYELRHFFLNIFSCLNSGGNFRLSTSFLGVSDPSELANDSDPSGFHFELEVPKVPGLQPVSPMVFKVLFSVDVNTQACIPLKAWASRDGHDEFVIHEERIKAGTSYNGYTVFSSVGGLDFSSIVKFAYDLGASRYFPAFRNAINEGAGNYYDLPVGTALVSTWDFWKAGSIRSNKLAISRVEEEIRELLGFKSLQINADQSGKTLDVIIDGRPHKLYEVGAGVAQLIIVLAAALVSNPPYILIDEPELSLHPSLQLNFLTALASFSSKGLLFSTHSIGLARSISQRIFVTRKLSSGNSSMEILGERPGHFAEMLGELSYSGRAELGCDGVLIVEGPTDVLLFQEFLRKYEKDAKFVVMQLGGASLINSGIGVHLAELARIVDLSKVFIFIDSEKSGCDASLARDRQQFVETCRRVGAKALVSERRATENYFTSRAIQVALGQKYQELSNFELLKMASNPWSKSDNWKIARQMTVEELDNTDLGRFLRSL